MYGSETWTMRKEDIKRLEAFEMWIWRPTGRKEVYSMGKTFMYALMTEGIKVGGQLTNALRFADDQAMIAASQKGLYYRG